MSTSVKIEGAGIKLESSPEVAQKVLSMIVKRGKQLQGQPFTTKYGIMQLVEGGFFDSQRGRLLKEIKLALRLKGLDLESTSLSPILYRDFVRPGIIERLGERKSYRYFVKVD